MIQRDYFTSYTLQLVNNSLWKTLASYPWGPSCVFSMLQADIENTGRPGYTTLENIDVVCHHHRVNQAQSAKPSACHKTCQSL